MRMSHYYLLLALVLVPCLVATVVTGIWHDGSQRHLTLGLFTAILCVATNTLLILFMIVTGRVLRAAMRARPLGREFLADLNDFFARKHAYPLALVASASAVATAVLGYGRFIGVSIAVHFVLGIATVLINLAAVPIALRTLRENQGVLDRAADELDRIDREAATPSELPIAEPEWAFEAATRWAIFAASAWLPYLYWGLVVWRGRFGQVPTLFLVLTTAVSTACLLIAWRRRGAGHEPG